MNGTIILCTVHLQVHNAQQREWQEVSQETFDELLALAKELGDVKIWEGACESCIDAAAESFRSLNARRYTEAMTRELGYDVYPALDASDE